MKKMDTSTRLLKTGPMSSWSESMALYNNLRINRVMLREEGKLAGQRSEIRDTISIICGDEMHRSADKKDLLPLLPPLAPVNGITFQANIIRCFIFKLNQADRIKKCNILNQNGCRVYFGQPSNVETVKRASMPVSTLSKLKSLLSHSLFANTMFCREFSMCFQKYPLRTERGHSKTAF